LSREKFVRLRGVRQHNLKNLDLDIPLNRLIAVTGVSGSGKSSLALHTLYAEGQRRYVETFSPYARQFLERMDPPDADLIEGIPPGIAIESGTAVRSSRSTVGTITEINDFLKMLFARLAVPHCPNCGRPIRQDTPQTIYRSLEALPEGSRLLLCFPYVAEKSAVWPRHLISKGFLRLYTSGRTVDLESMDKKAVGRGSGKEHLVVVDRIPWGKVPEERIMDSITTAFTEGSGRMAAVVLPEELLWFSSRLSCADCKPEVSVPPPSPNLFSFNSPLGACPECRGFGRTIGVDWDLVVPDSTLSLDQGAVKPWGTDREEYRELLEFCRKEGIPTDVPFGALSEADRGKILHGTPDYYGVRGFFEWLETKTYKMHVRVFLSRYRSYERCKTCMGTRYQRDTLLYRLKGATIGEFCSWSIERCRQFLKESWPEPTADAAADLLVQEIRSRLDFLHAVGLGYLSLDRQSRTLSGGEVQRVHLTRALGSALVNVLYVLDEPSVGLHARDQGRLMTQLRRLVDMGNTVVVVEHDPEMVRFCDEVIDLGPAGGEKGGRVLFQGPPEDLPRCSESLTGRYLGGPGAARMPRARRTPDGRPALTIRGAREHNLRDVTCTIPLGLLVGVSGVSGSGKSTLVEKTLYHNWLRRTGRSTETPGICDGLEGAESVREMILVDQQPIGRTPRANLLTYTGALDPLRKLLAQTPEAVARGLSTRYFSFNVPGGRCESCRGEGFERIEMQFLADVTVRCPQCNGRRFKDDILEIRVRGLSIGDILECTAQEVLDRFADVEPLVRALQPVVAIGLEYLRLGQPLSSLSGGEAQRLKLIRYLVSNGPSSLSKNAHKLFLLDEPTTGLHPHDLQKLLRVLDRLVNDGNTVVVVEHNLDLLDACDWILELGPEGGEEGGRIVAVGSPEDIAQNPDSPTGQFLKRRHEGAIPAPAGEGGPFIPSGSAQRSPPAVPSAEDAIMVRGAREHNLKLSRLDLPREKMTVLTGLSGSGKSTLAFDVLFAEGRRRYLECLSTYVRQYFKVLEKPDVDQVLGLPPTVAIEQRTSRLNRRSTVATITEVYHFLRLLYSKLGRQRCPDCGRELTALSHDRILALVEREMVRGEAKVLAPLVRGRKGIYRDLFLRLRKMGFQTVRVDGQWKDLALVPSLERHREHDIEVLIPHRTSASSPAAELSSAVRKALALGGGTLHLAGAETRVLSDRLYCPTCNRGLAPLDPRLFSFNSRLGACPSCSGLGIVEKINEERLLGPPHLGLREGLWDFLQTSVFRGRYRSWGARLHQYWTQELQLNLDRPVGELEPDLRHAILYGRDKGSPGLLAVLEKGPSDEKIQKALAPFREEAICPECGGARINRQARSVDFKGRTITDLVDLSIRDFQDLWKSVDLGETERPVGLPILREILTRISFLREVGLDYLTLNRSGDTLSGGEAQRIRLAAQLGSNLLGVCYILDEPTIGLHFTDNDRLLNSLEKLKDKGNTIIVVEHDPETMRRADVLIELGPAAGNEGGRLTARGNFQSLCRDEETLTGRWYGTSVDHLYGLTRRRPFAPTGWIEVLGAAERNLKGIDVRIPRGALTCVTGVSGAGKSTLVHEVIYRVLSRLLGRDNGQGANIRGELMGIEGIQRVLEVDHNPIGRTSRSIPATYVGVWDEIRRLYAMLPDSRVRGFTPGHFSFNVKGGRCENCKGQGQLKVEMHFLPDVFVPCESCGGRRFNEETLAVRLKGKNIAEVLAMTIEEASRFFLAFPGISRSLRILNELGLGYLTLGRPSPTLSGGEAQRIKLAGELGNHRGPTLYVLDEPTTGLHRADVKKLLEVMWALTDRGHTVVVIEHNLDFVWASDYVIDLGPGSGDRGGRLVVAGTPGEILNHGAVSLTARALEKHLEAEARGCRAG